ncbi:MAG: SDR family oxidoreductase [Myxococcota bacterium]
MSIFFTGATGHVGSALLPMLLEDPEVRVLALVRAKDDAHLEKRRQELLSWMPEGTDGARLSLVQGDVSAPGLGLSDRDRDRVLAEATSIVHSAASVRFDMPEDAATKENMASTENVLALATELAERGRLVRHDHVSTCYVAGKRLGRVFETECDEGQEFRNSYEWSKCQSEKKVRAAQAAGLPAAIHRPSIIVGDSRTGQTRSFNVLYWPLRLYATGWWRFFPGRADTLVDVVPVDYVARAIAELRRKPDTTGMCFHLAAGDGCARVEELVEDFSRLLGKPKLAYIEQGTYIKWVRPVLMAPLSLTKRGQSIMRGGRAFMPYFTANPLFDTTNARAKLGYDAPHVRGYIERIVQYAIETDFGRKQAS